MSRSQKLADSTIVTSAAPPDAPDLAPHSLPSPHPRRYACAHLLMTRQHNPSTLTSSAPNAAVSAQNQRGSYFGEGQRREAALFAASSRRTMVRDYTGRVVLLDSSAQHHIGRHRSVGDDQPAVARPREAEHAVAVRVEDLPPPPSSGWFQMVGDPFRDSRNAIADPSGVHPSIIGTLTMFSDRVRPPSAIGTTPTLMPSAIDSVAIERPSGDIARPIDWTPGISVGVPPLNATR